MSETVTNWNTKIKVAISFPVGSSTSIPFLNSGAGANIYTFKTIQVIDPNFDSKLEVQHSITDENIGYLAKPTELTGSIGVLASVNIPIADGGIVGSATPVSDVEVLLWLQMNRIEFILTMSDALGDGGYPTLIFRRCRIGVGKPGTLTPDGQPIANYTLRMLSWDQPAGWEV